MSTRRLKTSTWLRETGHTKMRIVLGAVACVVALAACAGDGIARAAQPPERQWRGPVQTPGDKAVPRYPGLGGGHYIKAVRDEGRFVTLEDNSVWEIEPNGRYLTAHWEVEAGISIRSTDGDDGYIYEIANVDKDEGAAARWVRP